MQVSEEIQKSAQELLAIIERLDATSPVRRSTRDAMTMIHAALQALEKVMWPREALVLSPVPDKIVFRFTYGGAEDLLFHNRADGIYFEGERLDHTKLTAEAVHKLVINKLTAFYINVEAT
jgi:hypothetical protein